MTIELSAGFELGLRYAKLFSLFSGYISRVGSALRLLDKPRTGCDKQQFIRRFAHW